MNGLAGQRQVDQVQFQQALGALCAAHDALREQLDVARGLYLPPLTNMTAGEPLGPFLLTEPLIPNLTAGTQTLDGNWINALMSQMGEALDKLARILFKSLGGILALQESLADRWSAARESPVCAETPAPAMTGDPTQEASSVRSD